MDLKEKIKQNKDLDPKLKAKLLYFWPRLSDEQKQKLEKALTFNPSAHQKAIHKIKDLEKKMIREIRHEAEHNESNSDIDERL
ncbi:hypothetical protein HN748_06515 [Candidatus Peregrinibacteria bacterium]|jgi:hypothetical protein|nr:hypothetical protein [Candidatus Peregrinibacteria bacterium]MBT7484284.1 hypothetical protein [Candidatus Peregrinibacteria bacterium]MBT7703855.1 hypothetical protein [Candidatus Peregrinibacteria bacterium]